MRSRRRREVWFRADRRGRGHGVRSRAHAGGTVVPGPAVIESLKSTILVPPGWQAAMDDDGFVLLTRGDRTESDSQ